MVLRNEKVKKWLIMAVVVAVIGGMVAWLLWDKYVKSLGPGLGFVSGNGRIEATEIDVPSAKAQVTALQSDTAASIAMVGQRESEFDVAGSGNSSPRESMPELVQIFMLLAPTTHLVML